MDSSFCGQKFIVEFLKNQLNEKKRLIQSLLFYGPAHLGKFSLALSFSQALLCEKKGWPACNNCPACRSVLKNNHPDLKLETESKDIDTSRAIINFLSYRPQASSVRIVLVDGFDQFTFEAQNTLLKTIEEPPFYSFIILIAEEIEKIIPTLRSRLMPLRFRPISQGVLVQWLRKERGLSKEMAEKIANLSRGRPGLALELLNSKEQFKAYENAYQLFFRLLNSNFLARSKIIKEIISQKDKKEVDFYLRLWLEAAEDDLTKIIKTKNQPLLLKKINLFKNLLKCRRLIETSNINRQLILENLFLEYGSN